MTKNQISDNLKALKRAFASSALEGLDNSKINQYIIDEVKSGINTPLKQIKNNPRAFLAQFD